GLSISASLGVRDNNEASWTQVLDVVEFMSDATRVPILLDGDTGFGNFNSVRRLIRKLEQRGVAGGGNRGKQFPQTNSVLQGNAQPLAEVEEFCGKIRAAKDSQQCPDFVVVARVESFIAGYGLGEALRRAEAYRQAGADAILIHSARSHPGEILSFKREWGDRLPAVIVPTKYYTTPTQVFRDAGFSVVIWANHLMRSALASTQRTAREIFTRESLHTVEPAVPPSPRSSASRTPPNGRRPRSAPCPPAPRTPPPRSRCWSNAAPARSWPASSSSECPGPVLPPTSHPEPTMI